MRNLTKALTVVSLLAPVSGHPLGIGDIRVRSALNQNLNAEIMLVSSRGENPANIKVSLAPPEKFDEAGVPWSYFLSKIKFQPIVKPNGSMVIKVTSREALKEPYLNFLLEVSWPKGNLYREFTVLVDPPAEYQQPAYQEPVYQEPAYPATSGYDNYAPPQQDYVPRHRPARHAVRSRRSSAGHHGGQLVTRRNDTLWNVAERARGAGVSVEQMMIALYEKNPHAFYQQNVNALSAGKRLTVPEKSVVQQTSRQEALAEFSRHNEAWNNNRSGVASGESQAVKEETPENQLKLEAPADGSVGANETLSPSSEQTTGAKSGASAPTSPEVQQPAPTKPSKASAPVDDALQSKVAALEKQMAMMQEIIALKDKQLAELQNPTKTTAPEPQPQPEVTPPASVPPVVAPTQPEQVAPPTPPVQPQPPQPQVAPPQVKPVPPVLPPKPVVKPIVKKPVQPEPVAEESSPLGWVLGGLAALLVPLFGWLWWRKKKILEETDAESMFGNYSTVRNSGASGVLSGIRKGPTSSISGESSFLNDFKASDFESFESFNVDHSDIDPVAEADVYLAYGRYQQAEDLIRQAIKDYPDRDDCKLKLFEIFHASSNKEAFEKHAMEMAAAGKKADPVFWGKVIELSKDISADTELFSLSTPSTVAVFTAEPDVQAENVLLSPANGQDTIKPADDTEHLGEAVFEISDIDEEESFLEPFNQETPTSAQEDAQTVDTEKPTYDNESDFTSFDHDAAKTEGNEALDFNLGPFPGTAKADENEVFSVMDAQTLSKEPQKLDEIQSVGADELESYEFDFNLDKTELGKPELDKSKPAQTQADDNIAWDTDQTIDFSVDDLSSTDTIDTFGDDTIDFNFEGEPSEAESDKKSSQSSNFAVSDLTDMDEIETKLDLAKAYIDMGDAGSAKEIIVQVLEIGTADQKKTAQMLMDELS